MKGQPHQPRAKLAINGGVSRVVFSEDYTSGTATQLPLAEDAVDFPTTADIYDGVLYIVNSQLDHLVPMFQNDAPPELPFSITAIDLETLGR